MRSVSVSATVVSTQPAPVKRWLETAALPQPVPAVFRTPSRPMTPKPMPTASANVPSASPRRTHTRPSEAVSTASARPSPSMSPRATETSAASPPWATP